MGDTAGWTSIGATAPVFFCHWQFFGVPGWCKLCCVCVWQWFACFVRVSWAMLLSAYLRRVYTSCAWCQASKVLVVRSASRFCSANDHTTTWPEAICQAGRVGEEGGGNTWDAAAGASGHQGCAIATAACSLEPSLQPYWHTMMRSLLCDIQTMGQSLATTIVFVPVVCLPQVVVLSSLRKVHR